MSISTASVLKDGTVSATGGTATSLKTKGQDLGKISCIFDDGSEFINQSTVLFQATDPKVKTNTPNGYTQARSVATIHVPLVLDNGNTTKNSLSITLSVDHESTDAEVETMLVYGAQLLSDSDFSDFWKKQLVD
jgi:hypothetical protein